MLNTTICTGIRLSTATVDVRRLVLIGCGLTRSNLAPHPFRFRPRGALLVAYQCCMDAGGEYLMVMASNIDVYTDTDASQQLCHFDYDRGKPGYPEAHLQIEGTAPALETWRDTADLSRVHFPTGHRRYRLILEDVIEFLIMEGFASPHDGWESAIAAGRADFARRQLSAAVLNDPETARAALAESDRRGSATA